MGDFDPREELERKYRHHQRWYTVNRILRDYSQALSIIISLGIPTGLLIIPTLPTDSQGEMNKLVLALSFLGVVFAILPLIFRVAEKTEHNKLLSNKSHQALLGEHDKKDDAQLVKILIEIEELEYKEAKQ